MSAKTSRLVARQPKAKARVSNGTTILPGVDGRSLIGRRYRDIASAIVADAGGEDNCSETKIQLIRRFSAASVLAETMEARLVNGEQIDIAEHAVLSSTLVRIARRIGVNRQSKNITPDLHDYIAVNDDSYDEVEHASS